LEQSSWRGPETRSVPAVDRRKAQRPQAVPYVMLQFLFFLHPAGISTGRVPNRATVKYAPIALENNETYRSRAVGAISINGETGDFVGAVIVAKTRDSKFARKGCPELASGLPGKLSGNPWARRQRVVLEHQ
jgi:hypothetical protein